MCWASPHQAAGYRSQHGPTGLPANLRTRARTKSDTTRCAATRPSRSAPPTPRPQHPTHTRPHGHDARKPCRNAPHVTSSMRTAIQVSRPGGRCKARNCGPAQHWARPERLAAQATKSTRLLAQLFLGSVEAFSSCRPVQGLPHRGPHQCTAALAGGSTWWRTCPYQPRAFP